MNAGNHGGNAENQGGNNTYYGGNDGNAGDRGGNDGNLGENAGSFSYPPEFSFFFQLAPLSLILLKRLFCNSMF